MIKNLYIFRRIPILGLVVLAGIVGTSYEIATTLVCVVFLIVLWILFIRFQKSYYFTGEWFNKWIKRFAGIAAIAIVYCIYYLYFSLQSYNHVRLLYIVIVIGFLVWLPYLVAEIFAISLGQTFNRKRIAYLKKAFPFHPWIRKAYHGGNIGVQSKLLKLEKHGLHFAKVVDLIIEQWIILGVLSPLTYIDSDWRNIYQQLLTLSVQDKMITFESVHYTSQEVLLKIITHGTVVPQDLISGKPRSKIIEALSMIGKTVRSISYDELTRIITIQYYTGDEIKSKVIADLIKKLEIGFTELDIKNTKFQYPTFKNYEVIDKNEETGEIYTIKCIYTLPSGLHKSQLSTQTMESLNSYVRLPVYEHKIKPHEDTFELYVELQERNLTGLSFKDFDIQQNLRIPLGFDLKYRKAVYMNFDGSTVHKEDYGFCPHYIIAGATGSGKSTFIKYIITQLLRVHTPDTLRLFLVDPKVVSFNIFKGIPHLYAPVVSDVKKISPVIDGLVNEVEKRYKLLAKYGVENIIELKNIQPDIVLPHILVIIDEFADIIDSHDWKIKQDIILSLKKLGQKARAAGIHMMLMTQRATSANIDGEIKANFSGRIAFRVSSEGDSHTILGEGIAADIERPGEGFARLGETDELVHFQVPYVTSEEIKEEIKKHQSYKSDYIDKALSDILLRKPMTTEEVVVDMFPQTLFPRVAIGMNLETHEQYYINFARTKDLGDTEPTPHIIVAGATNSGKSMFGKLLITQLMKSGSPDLIQLVLIDPKVVSFSIFNDMPHLYSPVVTKHEQLLPTLQHILDLIQKRYELFKNYEVENITEYREQFGEKLPSIVIVIDEFADLLDSYDYKGRVAIEKILKRFGQMARAAGVHMVLITQRATAQNIPGEIRTHFSGRVAFKMNSESDSFYLLDKPGAEQLESAGCFLYKTADGMVHKGYAPIMSKEYIKEYKKIV